MVNILFPYSSDSSSLIFSELNCIFNEQFYYKKPDYL
jgi:hypothetical protein